MADNKQSAPDKNEGPKNKPGRRMFKKRNVHKIQKEVQFGIGGNEQIRWQKNQKENCLNVGKFQNSLHPPFGITENKNGMKEKGRDQDDGDLANPADNNRPLRIAQTSP